jgi:sulfur relay (sulfurtransferase) DsrC/TusE family protein
MWELRILRNRKERTIANKPSVIAYECQKVVDSHKFLTNNKSFLIGARGEERVISTLSQLSDDYHVLNDVNLRFSRAFRWREMNEYIRTSQIDHVVIGPTGIFLLETKNWKASDIEIKSDDLIYQVRRKNLALWYYLKDYYIFGKTPRVRTVVVSTQGSRSGKKLDKYIDIMSPSQLCEYIARREITRLTLK